MIQNKNFGNILLKGMEEQKLNNESIRELKVRKKSVVKRIYAAVCMVLIAAMLATTASYAWLVMSLAPEASNVTTLIGSNGSLEIALGKNIEDSAIGNSLSKSKITQANRTWGNLIDLNDESYGLRAITLRPAILNSAGGAVDPLHPLAYPIYSADGRVQYIYANNMFAGTYNGDNFVTAPNDYGVHGIGTTQYHTPGDEGLFGPLSERQETFYNAQNNLWTMAIGAMTRSSYESLCESSQSVLMAYCMDGTGVSASEFDLNAFSGKVSDVVSAVNEELKLNFTLLAASESTSADNYLTAMELLKQEYPDYETLLTLVGSAIQAEGAENIVEAIVELRAFQNASKQLQEVIDSESVNGADGYSMEEIAQTVGLIFDLEKTSFRETTRDYWSNVISHLHYREYLRRGSWRWDYLDDNGFAVNDLTNKLINSNGQDNGSRETLVYEITHIQAYSLYRSLPLAELDAGIVNLYAKHWSYWDEHAEDYQRLQDEIAELEDQIEPLEKLIAEKNEQADSVQNELSLLETELAIKTNQLEEKKAELQALLDEKIYATDDSSLETIRTVMKDTIEVLRQYVLWCIAYCACDGQVPDDAHYYLLEIASSTEYIHPRTAYQALCNYGVTPQDELENIVASYENLEQQLLFLQKESDDADVFTWCEINEELQRIFGNITHTFYFHDDWRDLSDGEYSSSYSVEDVPYPTTVMETIMEEIDNCEAAIGSTITKKNATHLITYKYLDEENQQPQPWARALGLLTTFSSYDAFEYGEAEYTLADRLFSRKHSMWYAEGFRLSISVGVGSEDNFNESGLTVRQTRFKKAQANIADYRSLLIAAAKNPDEDIVDLLMQIIAGKESVSLVTVSEYLDSLQMQLEYGEAMVYQATLAMAASDYAEDNLYNYAYSDRAPQDAVGMIELLQSYNFDEAVLNAFAYCMALLNDQKAILNQSRELLKAYQDQETGALIAEQISVSEAVTLLNPVLDTNSLTLYGYISSDKEKYVRTVLYTGYGSPFVQINGDQVTVTGEEAVTIFGNVYLSLGQSFSGDMLAFVKLQAASYTPSTSGMSADEIEFIENDANRHSYAMNTGANFYTLNLSTSEADSPYLLTTDLWTYTGNTKYISADQTLVDIYGYSVDLSFRTNADDSDLLLQTERVDRIYNDGEIQNETTMGSGSYMKFAILDSSYSTEMAKAYMGCLRVVFTDTDTGYIYGYAALDMNVAEVIGLEIKAPLRLCDKDTGLMLEGDAEQYLCHLEKNLEKNLTVYVYLDGAKTSQSVVSATGEQSLSGVLNLQFCSSAALKPIELNDFRQ